MEILTRIVAVDLVFLSLCHTFVRSFSNISLTEMAMIMTGLAAMKLDFTTMPQELQQATAYKLEVTVEDMAPFGLANSLHA